MRFKGLSKGGEKGEVEGGVGRRKRVIGRRSTRRKRRRKRREKEEKEKEEEKKG